jgi:hypothetical protein
VIKGSLAAAGELAPADPQRFQDQCVEPYLASWTARGFSPVTIENDTVRGSKTGHRLLTC